MNVPRFLLVALAQAVQATPLSILHRALRGDWRAGLCWNVFRVSGSRRGDHTNRRTFQSCFYGRAHSGTECVVHAVR